MGKADIHRWHVRFFRGVALELWRKVIPPEQTEAEADYVVRALAPSAGASLLDVPCGNGRLSLVLARRGYRPTGVDLAGEFLEEARASAVAERLEADWHSGDMRQLAWDSDFDGAFCMGNSFGYFDGDETRIFVRAVARALRPGARFVVDTGMAAESILPNLEENLWLRAGDILMLVRNRYHVEDSRLETEYTFIREGVTDTRTAHHWVFSVAEMRRMLDEAGLRVQQLHSSTDGEPYHLGAPRLLLVAEKTPPSTRR